MQENKQEKSPIKQRILQYLGKKGISMYDCYAKTGITRGILGQNNGISEENLSKFLAYYKEVNLEWLILGHGSMIRSNDEQQSILVQHPETIQSTTNEQTSFAKMFMDKIDEKDAKIEKLQNELRSLEKELVEVKTKLSLHEPSPPLKNKEKENTTGLCDAGNASLDTTSQKSSSLTKKAASVSAQ